MKWYHWFILAFVIDIGLLSLVGSGLMPVEGAGILFALQIVILNWIVITWLLRTIVRWFRSSS